MSQNPIPIIPGLEYLNLINDEDDDQPGLPIPQMMIRPVRVHSPRTFRAIISDNWAGEDAQIISNLPRRALISNGRQDSGIPVQPFGLIENFRDQRAEAGFEFSSIPRVDYLSSQLANQGIRDMRNQMPQTQISLSPISVPPSMEQNPVVQDMINDLNEIENAESQLLIQIRQLEQAHSQLEGARMELINALVRLESSSPINRINDGYDEEEEENEDEEFLSELFSAHLRLSQRSQRLRIPRLGFEHQNIDYELFLDNNGNPCEDFADCILNAVGWTIDIDQGLDCNGNDFEPIPDDLAVR